MPTKNGNVFSNNPETDAKFHTNVGQWADKKKASEAGKKGAAITNARRKAMAKVKQMMNGTDGFREEALAAILEEHPQAADMIAKQIFERAMEGDKFSLDMMSKMFGMEAPKKTETKVESKEMSPEEAMAIIKKAQEDS